MEDKDKRAPEEKPAQTPGKDAAPKNAVQRLYDKIPLSYRQVDIIVKVLIAALVVVLILGIATGSGVGAA